MPMIYLPRLLISITEHSIPDKSPFNNHSAFIYVSPKFSKNQNLVHNYQFQTGSLHFGYPVF